MPENDIETKYCEICGKEISRFYPSGTKICKPTYQRRRFCSYQCKYTASSIEKRIENPRKNDRLYHVWLSMKARCNNPKSTSSKWYYEKGIKVCGEWQNDFISFRTWAINNGYDYNKTRKEQSLDRIDDSKGYSPDNCRWVTHSENCKNTTRNIFITYKGKTQCINDWSKELNMPIETIRKRNKRFNGDGEKIFDAVKFNYRSNTGIKGITYQPYANRYVIYGDGRKYLGVRRTLEDAIKLRNGTE